MTTSVPKTTHQTILIVDDTPENLVILEELLQSYYRVKAVHSGAGALRVATSSPPPDLILLDVMMPDMDGYTVLVRLQEDPATRDIPVIFVTAMNATEDETYGLVLGAVDYITKPIRPAIVLARVKTQLELKLARDRLKDQNAYLEAEVARRMHENQLIQDVSIRALASLAEARDTDTGNHILRTQSYVKELATHLQTHPRFARTLTNQTVALIVKSAPLHDIGKVGIPDSILLKPGKLTPDEWEVMKTHSRIGSDAIKIALRGVLDDEEYQILHLHDYPGFEPHATVMQELQQIPLIFLRVAMEIAHWHHERWDGSGYPDGLAGEDIPLSARLMALADVFDALISHRVYKAPMPLAQVVEIIAEGRGTHFDPDIVDAFLTIREKFRTIAERYADNEADIRAKLAGIQGKIPPTQ